MRRRAPFAALAATALYGCSDGGGAPPGNVAASVHLSESNRDANAAAIAAFFGGTCLQVGESAAALSGAVRDSGWQADQVQTASSAMPISGWRLESGELVHSAMTLGPANNFVDCELVLDGEVAPSIERMRDALRPLLRYPGLREVSAGPPEARWQWATGVRAERVLTVGPARQSPASAPKLSVHLRITETTLAEAPPPELNEIGIDAANVQ